MSVPNPHTIRFVPNPDGHAEAHCTCSAGRNDPHGHHPDDVTDWATGHAHTHRGVIELAGLPDTTYRARYAVRDLIRAYRRDMRSRSDYLTLRGEDPAVARWWAAQHRVDVYANRIAAAVDRDGLPDPLLMLEWRTACRLAARKRLLDAAHLRTEAA